MDLGGVPVSPGFDEDDTDDGERPKVFGDSAYGGGAFQKTLEDHDIDSGCKTQPPSPPRTGRVR